MAGDDNGGATAGRSGTSSTEERVIADIKASRPVRLSAAPEAVKDSFPGFKRKKATISGAFLAGLLVDKEILEAVNYRPIRIHGAVIEGAVDLTGADIPVSIEFINCLFQDRLLFKEGSFKNLRIDGCALHGFDASGSVAGSVRINRSVLERGAPGGDQPEASGGSTVPVVLDGAQVNRLDLSESRLAGGHDALRANVLTVRRTLRMRDIDAHGSIMLIGANIGGQLILRGATVRRWDEKSEVNLYESSVSRGVYINEADLGVTVRFTYAVIGGKIDATKSTFGDGTSDAFYAASADIAQSLELRRSTLRGGVDLSFAKVGGTIDMSGAHLSNPCATVLDATNVAVLQSIDLTRARADGRIVLRGAKVNGSVRINRTTVDSPDGAGGPAVDLSWSTIDQSLEFKPTGHAPRGVTLANSRIGLLNDKHEAWSKIQPDLRGLTYTTLPLDDEWSLRKRIEWIGQQPEHNTSPYEALAANLRDRGRSADARTVMYEREKAVTRQVSAASEGASWWRRILGTVRVWLRSAFGLFAGYGYKPARLVVTLLGIWLICAALFIGVSLVPNGPRSERAEPPPSHPLLVSADALLPEALFGTDAWAIRRNSARADYYMAVYYTENALGWLLVGAALATIGRLLQRE